MTQDAKPAGMPDENAESETEQDVSELARSVVQELEPGMMIDDKLILSRRQALAIATGTVSASALLGFASGTADAQSAAGQVGTSSQPVDVEAATVKATQVGTSSEPVDVKAATVNATDVNTGSINTDEIFGAVVNLSNGQTVAVPNITQASLSFAIANDGSGALVIFQPQVSKVKPLSLGAQTTTSEGNSGTLNIYHSSTNSRFEVENQRGFSTNVRFTHIRSGF